MQRNGKRYFFSSKITETTHREPPLRTFNSYSFNFNHMADYVLTVPPYCLLSECRTPCSGGEHFFKLPLAISLHLTPFRLKQTFPFLDVLGKEYYS